VTDSPRATVVIVNYNGAHLLPACLDALRSQVEDQFETIVVDNASADNSLALLAQEYPWAKVIANPVNLGFAGGNNVALRQVSTPYAVLLNNDAIPQPGWLSRLLATFEQPGYHDVGIVTGKVLFLPKFVRIQLETSGFQPASSDSRDLGVRIYRILVDGTDVTDKVLWEKAAYGPEGAGAGKYRWTRPAGEFLLPVPFELSGERELAKAVTVTVHAAAERSKKLTLRIAGRSEIYPVDDQPGPFEIALGAHTPVVDVINNVGGQVFADGSGGDRGFQEVDSGQYDEPSEVFTACGNGMAMRTAIGQELGWFDDGFFMYYEDTDLSWRWRARGWSIRYEPTAVLRHIHSASSKEWSPRWRFHVERNRMLMLTKNATAELAWSAVAAYVANFARSGSRAFGDILIHRRRPAVRVELLRAKVLMSFSTHAPRALRDRYRGRRRARVPAAQLQRWLVKR
jgi:GT2 family glycosyltransferase